MYSPSKTTPRRSRSGPSIELISGVSRFKSTFNPIISKENKQILEAKLAVEKESTAATTERLFNSNLYINYQKNPFNHLRKKKDQISGSHSFYSTGAQALEKPTRGKKLSTGPKAVTIMDEISQLQSSNLRPKTQQKINRFQKINDILVQTNRTSNKILAQLKKIQYQKEPIQVNPKPSQVSPRPKKQSTIVKIVQKNKVKDMSIDEILGMQDSNHFLNEGRRKFNIFKSLNNDQQIQSPYEQLCQHKFAFQSVMVKINKVMIPFFRKLSKFSRSIMCTPKQNVTKVIDIMENEQLSIKEKQIKFVDLMGFASGRLSCEIITQLNSTGLNRGNEEDSDTSSTEERDVFIPYQINSSQFQTNFKGESEEKKQIIQFEYIEPTQKQQKYRQKFSQIKTRIKGLLASKQFNLSNRILDKKLHQETQNKIQQTFQYFLSLDKSKQTDMDKIVRMNKINKSKDTSFRLHTMIDILKEKNQIDQYLNGSSRSRSKKKEM